MNISIKVKNGDQLKEKAENARTQLRSERDALRTEITELDIAGKYTEISWEMDLWTGGRMKHQCRKAVGL